jgi:streptomycin 6-kinase
VNGELEERLQERIRDWNVVVDRVVETEGSVIAFGRRDDRPVVLKLTTRQQSDEWQCGDVLNAFAGNGMVRAHEYGEGAVLMERLDPGTLLTSVVLAGRDDEATAILADVIHRMSPSGPPAGTPTAEDWAKSFRRYLAGADDQIPKSLVERGERVYADLCASQKNTRLLHGDLQHYNVLLDSSRGWVAIDPKGVIGELEYEVGASLRNPVERPDLLGSRDIIERRIRRYEAALNLDADRMLAWGFAQAVLSAIWLVEDGFSVDSRSFPIVLANAISPMLGFPRGSVGPP